MSRRKKETEHDNSERWLLSYADFITLLMIFFVIMYAMSKADSASAQALKEEVSSGFAGNFSLSDGGDGVLDGMITQELSEEEVQAQVKEEVDQYIEESGLSDLVTTSIDERGLLVSFRDSLFFESGEAEVKPDQLDKLTAIGKALNNDLLQGSFIRVEGYTDDLPMTDFKITSNWDLSVLRASNVAQILIDKAGIDPARLSAVGYGEYRPVADNSTAEGRAENRRVEILILNSEYSETESPAE